MVTQPMVTQPIVAQTVVTYTVVSKAIVVEPVVPTVWKTVVGKVVQSKAWDGVVGQGLGMGVERVAEVVRAEVVRGVVEGQGLDQGRLDDLMDGRRRLLGCQTAGLGLLEGGGEGGLGCRDVLCVVEEGAGHLRRLRVGVDGGEGGVLAGLRRGEGGGKLHLGGDNLLGVLDRQAGGRRKE